MDPVVTALQNVVSWIGTALHSFLLWIIGLAVALTAWIPNHVPLSWPEPESFGLLFRGIGVIGRFVHLPLLLATLTIMVTYGLFVMFYAAYRFVLGIVPTFK
jgi:hypothetical protein